ncbi:cell fate (sporulation/competence/biofilm development) regulator YlbF (YheA/YmcA/DUF963 family) [Pseudarthrobacter sp. W1I19]|nr:cell fate (sporulation/competence/biofilm development) regulator YlbF (YheA/YmcA/DUF963 family) [Pseudarthrobacter sp. W1I19]
MIRVVAEAAQLQEQFSEAEAALRLTSIAERETRMNTVLKKLMSFLADPVSRDFAAWENELAAVDIRLTSAAWVGWYEE